MIEAPIPVDRAPRARALGAAIAVLAALHKMLYASVLVNDDFMHRTYALQLLAGERPIRDFFDYGMGLMYASSALAQMLFGYRLFSEAALIGLMVGISTFVVYDVVRRVSASTLLAALAALLMVVAMPRGYGYPKLVVYAVAAALWWRYQWKPGTASAVVLGLWTAVAFYFRPDHGVYVAAGVAIALVVAHGLTWQTLTRCVQSGAVTLSLVVPWLVYASVVNGGFTRFVQSGMVAVVQEHIAGQSRPVWPLSRSSDLASIDGREVYTPTVGLRWTRDSTPALRQDVIDRYGLTVVATRNAESQTVRLSPHAVAELRALIAEPIVEDTDGIDRGAASVLSETWPAGERRRFEHWWLRLRVLPGLDQQVQAGEAATILLFAIPPLAMASVALVRRSLPPGVKVAHVIGFGLFAVIVDFGILRTPFHVRVGDAVVLPGIMMGVLGAVLLRWTSGGSGWRRWLPRAAGVLVLLLLAKSLAVAGQSSERVNWVAGEWTSFDRARGAWEEVTGRLFQSPPIDYWRNRRPEVTLRLAAYARECLPESDRILVTWFAPEIYYYSDRLMAGRHLFFLVQLGGLPHERQMELDKIRRAPPQIVFTRKQSERAARLAFPELFARIARDYRLAGVVEDADQYMILVPNDRVPTRFYGDAQWPCYR